MFEVIYGFSDLCIPYTDKHKELVNIIKQLIKFEYKNVAVEQVFNATDERNMPKTRDVFPEPKKLDFLDEFCDRIRILQRLTIIYDNNSVSHLMTNSTNLKKFNLIAGMPMTEQSLQHCCQTFNGDIVTFSLDKPQINFSRKYYNLAVQRRMYFEVKYSPAIVDSNLRRILIRKAHSYHSYGKSRNIILTSGAQDYIQLRSPYDVSHLGLLFGLSEEQARNAVAGACRGTMLRAEGRRFNKAILIANIEPEKESESSSEDENMDDLETIEANDDQQQPTKRKKVS